MSQTNSGSATDFLLYVTNHPRFRCTQFIAFVGKTGVSFSGANQSFPPTIHRGYK